MLALAAKARLPLIKIETDDLVNTAYVLESIIGEPVEYLKSPNPKLIASNKLYFIFGDRVNLDWSDFYPLLAQRSSSLIIVGGEDSLVFFDVGLIPSPKNMILGFVKKHAEESEIGSITSALAGVSFKQAVEISKLAMSATGIYNGNSVAKLRREFFGSTRGVEIVNTENYFYSPPKFLIKWVEVEKYFIGKKGNDLLRPRGLLFKGQPGTGKTMGAKFLAEHLNLPLYRVDIGIAMSKWAGESEKNLKQALNHVENCSPCIVLFDEIEKLFTQDDSGVSVRLLASLLWWLQEHKTPVFTIMTTNNEDSIPPELIRPGRIDRAFEFPTLKGEELISFANNLATSVAGENIQETVLHLIANGVGVKFKDQGSHAEVTTWVLGLIKRAISHEYKNI